MACVKTLNAWQSKALKENGKKVITFKQPSRSKAWEFVQLPCGRCIGCRLERSRQWAMRCVHEAKLHKENCFITLTFEDKYLKPSLYKKDFQKFMKRLRKHYEPKKIRYFHAGEYGELTARPHHHAILFGHDFEDKRRITQIRPRGSSKDKDPGWMSKTLGKLWPYGIHHIGECTFESAAYVARYCCKKQKEKQPLLVKGKVVYGDGRVSEYTTMSRRPGIGYDYYKKYKEDIFRHDKVVIKGKEMIPPKYYTNRFEITDPVEYNFIKERRLKFAKESVENRYERQEAREKILQANVSKYKRSL